MVKKRNIIALLLFITSFFVYLLTSGGNTIFNHYTLLANAFLHGKLYIEKAAPWLEQVPITKGSFYVANPPMPAVIAMPFVAIFGEDFPQQIVAHLIGAFIVVCVFFVSLKIKNSLKLAVWSSLLAGFGNIIWFLSADGSMWYLAQLTSALFLIMAIHELYNKKRIALITLFVCLAFLSRIQSIFYLPFFILAASTKSGFIKNLVISCLSAFPFIALFGLYNDLRFGDIFQTGLKLIPGLVNEPWFRNGIFSPTYIKDHFNLLFNSYPVFSSKFPFVIPTRSALAIWITSPVFILALNNNLKDKIVFSVWITIIFITLLDLSYGSPGISQFGYRYAVDIYPLIFLLIIKSAARTGIKWYHWVLLVLSVLVNLWGVVFLNKLDLASW